MSEGSELIAGVRRSLTELYDLLGTQGATSWQRQIEGVIAELDADGEPTVRFERAGYAYCSLSPGARGFAEYNVWREDEAERLQANRRLNELRNEIWRAFS